MVNIHVFSFNNFLSSARSKNIFEKTLSYQTDYTLFIWDEKSPEVQEIIQKSPYCQGVLSEKPVYYSALADFLKLEILSKYGGWVVEPDQLVYTNLSHIPGFDYSKACLIPSPYNSDFLAVTWVPIYIPKGFEVSEMMTYANTKCTSPLITEEKFVFMCKPNQNINNIFYYNIQVSHYCSSIFSFVSGSNIRKYELIDNKKIRIWFDNFYHPHETDTKELLDIDIFFEIAKDYKTFEEVLPKLAETGEITFSKQFKDLVQKRGFPISPKIKLI